MFCVRCFIFLSIGAAVKVAAIDNLNTVSNTTNIPSVCTKPTASNGMNLIIDGVPIFKHNYMKYKSIYITVYCDEGYELVGNKTALCVNGTYLKPLGKCVPKLLTKADTGISNKALCELPEHPKHGSYLYYGNANENIPYMYDYISLVFKCNYGYELKGNNKNRCSDGLWRTHMPTCKPKYGYLIDPLETGTRRSLRHCIVPDAPKHGYHSVVGNNHMKIPNAYTKVFVDITCDEGYQLHGQQSISCTYGRWTAVMPLCGLPCHLEKGPRVDYMCETSKGLVICKDYVRPGEIVSAKCNDNITRDDLTVMRCKEDGYFDYTETCAEENIAVECGLITVTDELIFGGFEVQWGQVPWHAGIYSKMYKPYMQICGGTIITSTAVISAAHCFWITTQIEVLPRKYSVGVGKIYRPWNDAQDIYAQKLEITEIKIPQSYVGNSAHLQSDLAVLKLLTAIEFNRYVRPICLDFNEEINENPLDNGMRKVAGWGLNAKKDEASQILRAVFLPIVNLTTCYNNTLFQFKPYITLDKICAGSTNGMAVCKGDSGGGLTFSRVDNGVYKHYLQGVVSNTPSNGGLGCNAYTWAFFTHIVTHKDFIKSMIK